MLLMRLMNVVSSACILDIVFIIITKTSNIMYSVII